MQLNGPGKKNGAGDLTDRQSTDILTLLGTALGCIGLSLDDFCRCTPAEFSAIHQCWADNERRKERGAWERTRMQCTTMLQPYSRHRLDPEDVLRFEWDGDHGDDDTEKLTAKEIRERFEKVKREQGLE